MKILIVEDDFASRKMMHKLLSNIGECDVAVNGQECVNAFKSAAQSGEPYELVTLDIMMPEMDGHQVLTEIRKFEENLGIVGNDAAKIVMTTALDDAKTIMATFKQGCEAYMVKPIDRDKLFAQLKSLGFNLEQPKV